ncbi:MAG TPA: outer membrane beta-barrel protein [Bacteroidia bacterium]|nr:outer membrane beta-barrel protein [Bacteroidia bacterium]
MKKLLALVFIITSVFVYAQDSTKTKKVSRFFIGVNFSPDYCFRTLKNTDGSTISAIIYDHDNKIERAKFGFSSGINACYIITKHISVDLGVQYSNKGYQTEEQALIYPTPRSATIYNLPTSGKFVYRYNYIDIPLKANFIFGKKKLRLISSVGLTTNIFISETNSFVGKYSNGSSFKNSSTSTSGQTKVNLSPTVSCGIDYKVNSRMFFRIEPTFRYGVLSTVDAPIAEYIWNAGLNISYYFGL